MDGYKTLQTLKQNEAVKDIPVIFISAYYTMPSMLVKGLEQGAFDYLPKPIDEDILLAKIQMIKKLVKTDGMLEEQKNKLLKAYKELDDKTK